MREHSEAGSWVPAPDLLHTPFSTVAISIEKGRKLRTAGLGIAATIMRFKGVVL
jgi:hypothetical protein